MGVILVFGGSGYPGALDNFGHVADFVHDITADHMNSVTDAIENLEAKVGEDGSAVASSLDYILQQGRHESQQAGGGAGSIAYILDTANAHSALDTLVSFRSNGAERVAIGGGGPDDVYIELGPGEAAGVSPGGRGRFMYDNVTKSFRVSVDGGGWDTLATVSAYGLQAIYDNGETVSTDAQGSIDLTRGLGTPVGEGALYINDLNAVANRTVPLVTIDDQGQIAAGAQIALKVSHAGSPGTISAIRSEVAGSLDTVWQSGLIGGATISARIIGDGTATFTALVLSNGTEAFATFGAGSTAIPSAPGTMRLVYDEVANEAQVSLNGAAYTALAVVGAVDHGALLGLGDDDHAQYVHISVARSITAQHSFSPAAPAAPFALGANAQGQLVTGLNADTVDGLHAASFALAATIMTAGAGLTGGGDLSAGRTFDVVANADGSIVVNANDIQLGRIAGATAPAAGATNAIYGVVRLHAAPAVADTPIAAGANLGLTAGAGLTGGGNLTADRSFAVGANIDGSITVNADDIQVGVLATDAQHGNRGGAGIHALAIAAGDAGFMSGADKTKLDGLPASAVPTTRTLTAGAGLAGGGDLSADRTFDAVANADGSIVVNANDIQLGRIAGATAPAAGATNAIYGIVRLHAAPAVADTPIAVGSNLVLTAGAGLTGGGDLTAARTFDVVANADGSIVVNANDIQLGRVAGATAPVSGATNAIYGIVRLHAAPAVADTPIAAGANLSLTAGAGLTGGGNLTADRSFAVGAGTGITVNADDVAVSQGYAFAWTADHTWTSASGLMTLTSTNVGDTGYELRFLHDSASPLSGDYLGDIVFRANNDAGAESEWARFRAEQTIVTVGGAGDTSAFAYSLMGNGSLHSNFLKLYSYTGETALLSSQTGAAAVSWPAFALSSTTAYAAGQYVFGLFDNNYNNALLLVDGVGQVVGVTGSATAPTYTTSGDLDTGAFSSGADQFGITLGGSTLTPGLWTFNQSYTRISLSGNLTSGPELQFMLAKTGAVGAVNDSPGSITFYGTDDQGPPGNPTLYGAFGCTVTNATNLSEAARLDFYALGAGTWRNALQLHTTVGEALFKSSKAADANSPFVFDTDNAFGVNAIFQIKTGGVSHYSFSGSGLATSDGAWQVSVAGAAGSPIFRRSSDLTTGVGFTADFHVGFVSAGVDVLDVTTNTAIWKSTSATDVGMELQLYQDSVSPLGDTLSGDDLGDDVGFLSYYGEDGASAKTLYAQLRGHIINPAAPNQEGSLQVWTTLANVSTKVAEWRGGNFILPKTSAVAGAYSRTLRLTGQTSVADRNIDIVNEASAGSDSYALYVRNNAGAVMMIATDAGRVYATAGYTSTSQGTVTAPCYGIQALGNVGMWFPDNATVAMTSAGVETARFTTALTTLSDTVTSPTLKINYNKTAAGVNGDLAGSLIFSAKDTGGGADNFAKIEAVALAATAGGERGQLNFYGGVGAGYYHLLKMDFNGLYLMDIGSLIFNNNAADANISLNANSATDAMHLYATGYFYFTMMADVATLTSYSATATGQELQLYQDSASPLGDDKCGLVSFYGNDTDATPDKTLYSQIVGGIKTTTDGGENGFLAFYRTVAGVSVEFMRGSVITPGNAPALSFFGVTPIVRPVAYTQTYATADKTHANMTSSDLALNSGSSGFANAIEALSIATEFNKLRDDVEDLKQLANSIIDDLQAFGLAQ